MKLYIYALGLLSMLLSCSARPERQKDVENVGQTETLETVKSDIKDSNSVLYKSEILHNFSSPNQKDSFKIYVTGKSISEGEVTFRIVSYSKEILLEQKFPSNYLIGYGLVDRQNPTEKEKEDYIKKTN